MLGAAFRCGRLPSGRENGAWGAIEVVGSWEASAAAARCDCDERARFEAATPEPLDKKMREIAKCGKLLGPAERAGELRRGTNE